MFMRVRLIKPVLHTALVPPLFDAFFLGWNLLNEHPGPSRHLPTVTHTAAEVLAKQVAWGWYVRGGT